MFAVQNFLRNKLNNQLDIPSPKLINTSKGQLEYIIIGAGKPVLIIHGGLGGYDQAAVMFRKFIPAGFMMICPSRPGYLGTPLSTGETIQAQTEVLVELINYLGFESVTVVAISAGGLAAYSLAINYPERVQSLIVIDAISGEYLNAENNNLSKNMLFADFGLWAAKESMVYFPEMAIKNIFNAEGYIDSQRTDSKIKEIINDPEQLGLIAEMMNCMSNFRPREIGTNNDIKLASQISWFEFNKINCPTFVIHGTHDAEVKFYHGVFAFENIASLVKDRFWIEYGTHFGFFFSKQSIEVQGLFKEFI